MGKKEVTEANGKAKPQSVPITFHRTLQWMNRVISKSELTLTWWKGFSWMLGHTRGVSGTNQLTLWPFLTRPWPKVAICVTWLYMPGTIGVMRSILAPSAWTIIRHTRAIFMASSILSFCPEKRGNRFCEVHTDVSSGGGQIPLGSTKFGNPNTWTLNLSSAWSKFSGAWVTFRTGRIWGRRCDLTP